MYKTCNLWITAHGWLGGSFSVAAALPQLPTRGSQALDHMLWQLMEYSYFKQCLAGCAKAPRWWCGGGHRYAAVLRLSA